METQKQTCFTPSSKLSQLLDKYSLVAGTQGQTSSSTTNSVKNECDEAPPSCANDDEDNNTNGAAKTKPTRKRKPSAWVTFLKANKGQGKSMAQLSKEYHALHHCVSQYPNTGHPYTIVSNHLRLKSEFLLGEDIVEAFEDVSSSAVIVTQDGRCPNNNACWNRNALVLEQFPDEPGLYLVLIRPYRGKRWIPVYLGSASKGIRRRMQDYIKKKDFSLDDKFKGKALDHLKAERFSMQVRFFQVSSDDIHRTKNDLEVLARNVERAILQVVDFPLNQKDNGKYRDIENLSLGLAKVSQD